MLAGAARRESVPAAYDSSWARLSGVVSGRHVARRAVAEVSYNPAGIMKADLLQLGAAIGSVPQ
jgi:hypothetical protein